MLFWSVAITIIFECSIVCLEAVARRLDDVSDDWLKCEDVQELADRNYNL